MVLQSTYIPVVTELTVFLRDRRRKLRMNQAQLAVAAGISEPTIRRYEREGFPRDRQQFDKLLKLLDVLRIKRVALDEMMDGHPPRPEHLLPIDDPDHSTSLGLDTPAIRIAEYAMKHGYKPSDIRRAIDLAKAQEKHRPAAATGHREEEERSSRKGK